MVVVKRGVGCGGRGSVATRLCTWTSDAGADGEVVWSRRPECWRQVPGRLTPFGGDGGKRLRFTKESAI
jgi:hypothetical protein